MGQQARVGANSRVKACQQAGRSMLHREHVGSGPRAMLEGGRNLHPCHGLLVHVLYRNISIMLQGASVGAGKGRSH
ncbi:MAG: hypothetical protein ACK559_23295, partial [bacterium]